MEVNPETTVSELNPNFQERYRALMQAAKGLVACTSLDSIVHHLLRYSIPMMQTEACSMLLPDRSTEELIIYSARGEIDRGINTQRIPWHKGIAGYVFHQRVPVCVNDVHSDERFLPTLDHQTGFTTKAMLCLPLLENEECLGVLQAINPLHGPAFTELDQEIFEGLAGLVTSALVRLENQQLREDEARLQREMTVAHEIQTSYLPTSTTIHPRAEVHVHYQSARTLGGDFYAVIPLSQNATLFALGDVSGKGVPAALTTAQVMGELTALAVHSGKNLLSLVQTLNQHLCSRLNGGRFVATTFMLYEPERQEIEIICAGQMAPWHWDGFTWHHEPVVAGLPLGVFGPYPYKSTRLRTLPGERWLLSSDGINEGRDRQGQEYSLERLGNSLGTGLSRDVLDRAWKSWQDFVGTGDLHDDACLGMLSCVPAPTMRVLSGAQNCKIVRAYIESWAMHAGLEDLARGEIVLAMDEAFTNVLRHAYNHQPDQPIELNVTLENRVLCFRMRDFGVPFPDQIPESAPGTLRPGGFGIPILRKIFCQVRYVPQEVGTEVCLIKNLASQAPPEVTVTANGQTVSAKLISQEPVAGS